MNFCKNPATVFMNFNLSICMSRRKNRKKYFAEVIFVRYEKVVSLLLANA